MARSEWIRRLQEAKIPLLLLAVSLIFLLVTGRRDAREPQPEDPAPQTESTQEAEERLAQLLECMDGVGEARVLLSLEYSSEEEFLSDAGETVILSGGSGKQTVQQRRVRSPRYLGAVVVCRGGDDAAVRLQVTEAVARFTGLRSDRITVCKLAS